MMLILFLFLYHLFQCIFLSEAMLSLFFQLFWYWMRNVENHVSQRCIISAMTDINPEKQGWQETWSWVHCVPTLISLSHSSPAFEKLVEVCVCSWITSIHFSLFVYPVFQTSGQPHGHQLSLFQRVPIFMDMQRYASLSSEESMIFHILHVFYVSKCWLAYLSV